MIRWLNIALLVTTVVALVGVYALKYQSEGIAADKVALERKIAGQEARLSLLRADWALLNQPGHIAPIIARHEADLKLAVLDHEQFIHLDDLPMRPARINPDDLTALLEALESGYDPIAALIEAN